MAQDSTPKRHWTKYLPIRRTKLRLYLILSGLLIGLFNGTHLAVAPFAVGVILMALAAWIHVWSKGHLDKNASLTRSGPYRWVRDPFHFSNFLMDLGLCLLINNWIFTVIAMGFWVIAYNHRLGEEDEMLLELFGDDYRDYRARIPRMFPYKKPMDKQYDKPFSVRHAPIYHGSVCARLFRFASYPYLLSAAILLGGDWNSLVAPAEQPLFYWALGLFVFFHVLSEAAARIARKRQSLLPLALLRKPVPAIFAVVWTIGLWMMEQWPGDFAQIEPAFGWGDLGLALLLGAFVVGAGLRVWRSSRFRPLVEGVLLTGATLFSPLPWLALVPACLYAIAFLYGDPDHEQANVDHLFTGRDTKLVAPRYVGGYAILLVAQLPTLLG